MRKYKILSKSEDDDEHFWDEDLFPAWWNRQRFPSREWEWWLNYCVVILCNDVLLYGQHYYAKFEETQRKENINKLLFVPEQSAFTLLKLSNSNLFLKERESFAFALSNFLWVSEISKFLICQFVGNNWWRDFQSPRFNYVPNSFSSLWLTSHLQLDFHLMISLIKLWHATCEISNWKKL